jgi:predicted SprT family Zn-dependent metalloprotease
LPSSNVEFAEARARELFIAHGLMRWSFGFDRAVRRAGQCSYRERRITLSRHFVEASTEAQIEQVLLHEVAHALAGQAAGHGLKWRQLATSLGYRHERIDGRELAQAKARWVGHCPEGHEHFRQRRATQALSCKLCSPRFDSRHLIVWRLAG